MKKQLFTNIGVGVLLILTTFTLAAAQTSPEALVRNLYQTVRNNKSIIEMSEADLKQYFVDELSEAIYKAEHSDEMYGEVLHIEGRAVTQFRISRGQPQTAAKSLIIAKYSIGSLGNSANTMDITDRLELTNPNGNGWKITEIISSGYDENDTKLTELVRKFSSQDSSDYYSDAETQISTEALNEKAKYLAKPFYSAKANAENITGRVEIEILINEEGNVVSAKMVSGNAVFKEAVEKAALESTFYPTVFKGRAVKVTGRLVYTFSK